MKKIKLDQEDKDMLWFLVYPIISLVWLLCLTCSRFEACREPDIYNNNYTIEDANVTIKTPVQVLHDTIYMDTSKL